MSEGKREEILGRIREALRIPAPHSHGGDRSRSRERAPAADRSANGSADRGQEMILDTLPVGEHTFAVRERQATALGVKAS